MSYAMASLQIRAKAELELRRRQAQETAVPPANFSEWLDQRSPMRGNPWRYRHLRYVQSVLDRVESGELDRVIVCMPPRSYKTEMVTVRWPVYRLEKDPAMPIIVGAYDHTLAAKMSRKARTIARQFIELDPERQAVDDWQTAAGGGMRAAGMGGGFTGHGGKLILIDDPIKNRLEANSLAFRNRVYDGYTDDLYTRLEPGGSIVLTMTRWHEDDLVGRILASEDGPNWFVVRLPALAESQKERDEYNASLGRPSGEPDPLGREVGEPLNPERFPKAQVEHTRIVMGTSFYALHQQRPTAPDGDMFKRDWFDIVPAPPAGATTIIRLRYWDKAGTQDAGAFTAGVLLSYHDGVYFIEDCVMGQWAASEREKVIKQTAEGDLAKYGRFHLLDDGRTIIDAPGHIIGVEQEGGSGGKESAENTIKNLQGYTVYADHPSGDKVLRAEPFAAQCGIRNVKMVRGAWNITLLGILTAFPNGVKDPVDALSGAFSGIIARLRTSQPAGEVIDDWDDDDIYKSKRKGLWQR